jgi:pimeloyl-ACP methyl ester carboxylesterase
MPFQANRKNPARHEINSQLGKGGKSGILFMGTDDRHVPFAHHTLVQAAIPSIEFHAIKGGDHSMIHELPEAVNPLLIEFLKLGRMRRQDR